MKVSILFVLLTVMLGSAVSASATTSTKINKLSKGKDNEFVALPGYTCFKNWQSRLFRTIDACGFDNILQGALTTSVALDFFNGVAFMITPRVAAAAAGLPNVPGSVSSVMGSAFLSSSVCKAQALRDAPLEYKRELAKNQLVPLGALAAYLIATPFAPSTTLPMVAFRGVAAPLVVTSGLAYANLKASTYEPPKK